MITISVNEPFSDWYRIVDKEIYPECYTHFKLKASELVWYLEMYQGNTLAQRLHVETSPKKLIQQLNITEIKGNKYRTIKEII